MASERLSSRPACLLVASGAAEGVSAQSFLHCFSLASATFNLQVATPGGKTMDFVDVNESNARWVQDFRLKAYANPAKLESIDGARYHALLIPSCPGALADLASSGSLARILQHFRSESKPICAVGHGVAALCCATNEDRSWVFQGYSVTGPVSPTPCTWCWTATLSQARTPAPPSQPCTACSFSAAAGSEMASRPPVDAAASRPPRRPWRWLDSPGVQGPRLRDSPGE
ncbi:glutamine amidotransferase-like class 1 domain-containing protein 1 isoform X1 [Mirounga angustirostris]|uniref:glutamine amidotransferase-like class 1 domain-containing protein 1 isoform X1 n=2 Tax=Mirounga angustirostris TaxID=9716 RepID=UPI00313C7061